MGNAKQEQQKAAAPAATPAAAAPTAPVTLQGTETIMTAAQQAELAAQVAASLGGAPPAPVVVNVPAPDPAAQADMQAKISAAVQTSTPAVDAPPAATPAEAQAPTPQEPPIGTPPAPPEPEPEPIEAREPSLMELVIAGRMSARDALMVAFDLEPAHVVKFTDLGKGRVEVITAGGQRVIWPDDEGRKKLTEPQKDGQPRPHDGRRDSLRNAAKAGKERRAIETKG